MTGNGKDAAPGDRDPRRATVRKLNDGLRQTFEGGDILMTPAVRSLPIPEMKDLLVAVQRFDAFTEENDPHGEHDFGSIEQGGATYFWKIDCYDRDRVFASPDPADPSVTARVMTVMRADEY
ncbi:DUF3768 domain-containing protein [Pararhizobium mangrovi]|uniref:DUF3768 domain-containing protein n=1 Tax=Pararhizobium mangrovi TaxID=2590452 RepID=A0A506U3T6_9HYPH|nr:DUF3768 domain-containing protein [Pararhizobium mangrovi]TPW26547.1 DUF3768 domain-containing protein [Pararhizobium mangrovi]